MDSRREVSRNEDPNGNPTIHEEDSDRPHEWSGIGPADLIPLGEGREFLVDGKRVAVFRARGGELYATEALCPHRQGPLADGLLGGGRVVCPLHSLAFDLSTGRAVGGGCSDLRTYRVSLDPSGEMRIELPGQEATEAA